MTNKERRQGVEEEEKEVEWGDAAETQKRSFDM